MAKSPRSGPRSGSSKAGRLRIVAGKWRRRRVAVADVDGLRPTAERVRETLFNWLADRIEGAHCLDLCAGSGALGFEALSRGAASVTFVEQSRAAVRGLRAAAAELGATDAKIVPADALAWLEREPAAAADVVFLDPPYRAALLPDLCRLLDARGWLAANARIYVEQDRRDPPAGWPARWRVLKDKTAGNVRYLLLAPDEAPADTEETA